MQLKNNDENVPPNPHPVFQLSPDGGSADLATAFYAKTKNVPAWRNKNHSSVSKIRRKTDYMFFVKGKDRNPWPFLLIQGQISRYLGVYIWELDEGKIDIWERKSVHFCRIFSNLCVIIMQERINLQYLWPISTKQA